MKIVGFGDFLIHFSPIGDERFVQTDFMQMSFTGAEANVCSALSYWGVKTEFITRLPKHFLAQKGISFLKGIGIITDNIPRCEERMGAYYLENGRSLRPSYVIYDRDNSAFTKSEFSDYNWDEILEDANVFYLSGITPTLSQNLLKCCINVLKKAREQGIDVFFDINYRPSLCSSERSKEIIAELLPYITHLIGNEEHFKMIFGLQSEYGEDEPYQRISDLTDKIKKSTKIDNVAITVRRTLSSSETIIYSGYNSQNTFAMSPQRNINVIDRVGSGDAFSAGLIYGYVNGYSVENCINFASASCAFKHTVTKDINFASVEEINGLMVHERSDVKR